MARNAYDGKPVTVGSVAKDAAVGAVTGVAGYRAGRAAGAVLNRVKGAAGAAEVSEGAVAGSIKNVNKVGGDMNCVNCAIATDATLAGRPASALGTVGPQLVAALEKEFGAKFSSALSTKQIQAQVGNAGQRGIVLGVPSKGGVNHVFNVVNQKGVVRFLDGQTGKAADLTRYKNLFFLPTTK